MISKKNFVSLEEFFKMIDTFPWPERVIEELRLTRKLRGKSQEDISKETGIPRSTISKVERGKRNVTWETLIKLCMALDVRLELKQNENPS